MVGSEHEAGNGQAFKVSGCSIGKQGPQMIKDINPCTLSNIFLTLPWLTSLMFLVPSGWAAAEGLPPAAAIVACSPAPSPGFTSEPEIGLPLAAPLPSTLLSVTIPRGGASLPFAIVLSGDPAMGSFN